MKKFREKFYINKVIFVGDKGILSKRVLKDITESGYEYIVAAKLKGMPKKYQEEILNKERLRRINEDIWIGEKEIEGKRLIIGWSQSKAERDRAMREAILEKLRARLAEGKSSFIKPSYSKYIKVTLAQINIDEERIREDERWDGYFGYITNNRDLREEQVLGAYKMLYKVEEAFRCLKSSLDIRPVYHWKERRIQGHIMLCFLSFYVLRVMQRKLTEGGIFIEAEEALKELDRVRVVEIETDRAKVYARTEISGETNKILRALGVKIPQVVLKEKEVV
ncbi:MAG: IS1634 family transposase [Thermodesulfovibrio sp.]|nr:IS1634 family transposase [Thermodesulfovibrio sp.]